MLFQKQLSVKKEILFLSLFSFVIIFLVFGILFAKSLFNISRDSAKRSIQDTNRQISIFAEGFFSEITNTLNMLAMHEDIRFFSRNDDDVHQRALSLYQNILKSNENILYVYSGYADKYLLIPDYTPPEGFDPTQRPWYVAAVEAMPGIATGVPYHEANSGKWVFAPSKALLDRQGSIAGVVSIDISLESIIRLLRQRYRYETQVSYAVSKDGIILIHPDDDRIGTTISPLVQNQITGVYGAFEYEEDSLRQWAHYDTIESTGWVFITVVAKNEILSPIFSRIFIYAVFIIGVSSVLGVLQSLFLSRRFAGPLIDLGERVAAITAGRPGKKVSYGYSNSEIASIARNIEHLTEARFSRKAMDLKAIIESTQDGILVVSMHREIIYVNSRFRQLWHFGQEAGEGADETVLLLMAKDHLSDPVAFMEEIEALYASDRKKLLSVNFRDGRVYEIYTAPLISDARMVGRIWSSRDITERKRAEAALRESEQRFKTIIQNLPGAVFAHDFEGRLLFVNKTASINTGYSEQELLAMNVEDIDSGGFTKSERDRLWHGLKIGESKTIRSMHARKDGSKYPVEIHLNAIRLDNDPVILPIVIDVTERIKAEETLRKTSEKLQAILDHSPLLISEFDLNGCYRVVNPAIEKLFNLTSSEIVGKTFHDILPPDSEKIFMERISRIVGTRESITVEDCLHIREGELHFNTTLFPLFDSSGVVRSIGAIAHDVTARKHAEDALRESEEKHRRLFETMAQGVIYQAQDGKIISANPAAEKILGMSFDQMRGRTAMDTRWKMIKEDASEVPGAQYPTTEALRTGRTVGPVIRGVLNPDKNFHAWLSITAIPLFQPGNKKPFQAYATFEDITERKQAEQELRLRENLLQRIFDILPIGLWFADKHGKLLRGNPAGLKIWGAEPLVDPSEYGVFKARRYPGGEEITPDTWALVRTIRKGVTILNELLEIDAFDGKKKIILNSTAPVFNEKGDIEGAVVINQDVTEREKIQAQLNQAQKMESIGRLAGGVAHDFNNMLSIINGYAEMMAEVLPPSDPMHDNVLEIQDAGKRAAVIVRKLLAFARKQIITPVPVNINGSVANMLKMLQRLIGENIDLLWKPGKNIWPVKMDYSQIDQILANLAVNARDAIADTGKITIETENIELDEHYCANHSGFVPGQFVMLAVSDNGCGMDKDVLENVFEPFFTTKEIGKGTGLGMPTIYGVMKQNNGFINVYSEPGIGTTVKLYFPRYIEDVGIPDKKKEEEALPKGRGETVLVLEDESAVLNLTRIMLERLGYKVITADRPGEAMASAKAHMGGIDLLLTDIVMPEMNGREFADQLKGLFPEIKVLFMSGYTANVIAHHTVLDEGVHFVEKPFSINRLAAKVREVLDR